VVKVDLERVDTLVELVGELAVIESMVIHAPEIISISTPRIRNNLSQLSKISRDLQSVGLRMRMVPVSGVFQKMARLVRDLSSKSGKKIRLVSTGENTEMDRSMVEQIHDPLVHMIRNSVDHGIENPDVREKAGKQAQGVVRLSAYHEGSNVVIEIDDDGKGLDRDAIIAKAKTQGLIKEGENLSENEIFNLIFKPGFSTAKQVTEISGRGVGMDVVKRNIETMRGRVNITSMPGKGTNFKIVLPLTLAIIDGMLVECGPERYIIPTLSIVESIKPDANMLSSFADQWELINVRGEIFPLMRLDRLFEIEGAKADPTQCLVVVVESLGRKVGLLMDDVMMRQQVVIKTLDGKLKNSRFLSGAAILSDGKVGLILNVDEIGNLADNSPKIRNAGTQSGDLGPIMMNNGGETPGVGTVSTPQVL
jgi:two-component system, chemotaxis family, sensor kinase CheA